MLIVAAFLIVIPVIILLVTFLSVVHVSLVIFPLLMLIVVAALLAIIPVVFHLAAFVFLLAPVIFIPLLVIMIIAAFLVVIPVISMILTIILVIVILFKSSSAGIPLKKDDVDWRWQDESNDCSSTVEKGEITQRAMSCIPRFGFGTQAAVALYQSQNLK